MTITHPCDQSPHLKVIRMRTIHLHGRLGKELGTSFEMDVQSVTDAVRALCANFPQAAAAIGKGTYRIVCGNPKRGTHLDKDTLDLYLPTGQPLHIIPARGGNKSGSGSGAIKTVVGLTLVAAAFVFAGPAGGTAASMLFTSMASMGVGLTLTGISMMLTSAPKMPSAADFEGADETPSFLLGGPTNATGTGNPVPIVIGTMRTGGVVISGGVSVEDFV